MLICYFGSFNFQGVWLFFSFWIVHYLPRSSASNRQWYCCTVTLWNSVKNFVQAVGITELPKIVWNRMGSVVFFFMFTLFYLFFKTVHTALLISKNFLNHFQFVFYENFASWQDYLRKENAKFIHTVLSRCYQSHVNYDIKVTENAQCLHCYILCLNCLMVAPKRACYFALN